MKKFCLKDFERVVFVFQGGGALGAYQVGLFRAFTENDYQPDWLIGTSIGAVNASIIAGNAPQERLEKLMCFWETISQDALPPFGTQHESFRRYFNFLSAERSLITGVEQFFYPNIRFPWLAHDTTPDQISYYVIEPLKQRLTEIIDFDRINKGDIRLTLSSVEIEHGKTVYFDNQKETITPEHILASAALPPGFPAVKINGKYYWDGGIYSNAPSRILLTEGTKVKTLCILAHLFDSYGLLPTNLDDVLKRHKDIQYASHTQAQMENYKIIYQLRHALSKIANHLPASLINDPEVKHMLAANENLAPLHFARFLYDAPVSELSSRDYEFSKLSMVERMTAGYEDVSRVLKYAPWFDVTGEEEGIIFHEFHPNPEVLASNQKNKTGHPRLRKGRRRS